MVFAQSSRRNQLVNKSLFPVVNQTSNLSVSPKSYAVFANRTQTGDMDVQLKETKKANAGHLFIIAGVIGAVLLIAHKKLGSW